jgi:hypothetical protein
MANFNLNSVALICEFNASVWTARKLDRNESAKVCDGAGAKNKSAARVNKNLFAGRSELEDIGKLVTETRNYVYDNTLPWSDSGQRMLIGARFPKFDQRVEDYRDQFNAKVQAWKYGTDLDTPFAVLERVLLRAPVILRATEGFTARMRGLRRRWLPMNSAMIGTACRPKPPSCTMTLPFPSTPVEQELPVSHAMRGIVKLMS